MSKTKQVQADDWMCEKINEILIGLNDYSASNLAKTIGQIEAVMMRANRLKTKEGLDRLCV